MCNRLDTILACDGQTDRQTSCHDIVHAMHMRRAVKTHGHGPDLPLMFKMHAIWSVDSQENHENCCHHMSDFKAKMHQIRFRLAGGAYSAPPDLLARFKGAYFKEKEREGIGGEKRKGVGRGGEREGKRTPERSPSSKLATTLLVGV